MKFSHKNIPCVVKDVDLGISRCMWFKSRALFCPVSPRQTYPCTRVHYKHSRCRHVQISELFSMEKCDQAVMDFLAATDVGKFPPKQAEERGQEERGQE